MTPSAAETRLCYRPRAAAAVLVDFLDALQAQQVEDLAAAGEIAGILREKLGACVDAARGARFYEELESVLRDEDAG